MVFGVGGIAMAVYVPRQHETPAGIVWFLWVLALLPAAFLTLLVLRYTTIGLPGIGVHTGFKTQTVTWSELAEVRWHRTDWGDTLLLCTHDGREIKTVGAEVHFTGMGRRRMERMLADIGRAWAMNAGQP